MGTSVEPTNAQEADAQLDAAFAAASASEPQEGSESQPRDDAGRFAAPPQAESEPSTPVEAETPAPESPETPDIEAEPEAVYEPFRFRADNADHEIPGSQAGEDGIFIPTESLPHVQQLFAAGVAANGSVRQRLTEASQREQSANVERDAARAESAAVLQHFQKLVADSLGKPWDQSPAYDFLNNLAVNWDKLQADAKVIGMTKQNEARDRRLAEFEQKEQQSRLEPMIQSSIGNAVERYGQQHGLPSEIAQEVYKTLTSPEYRNHVVVTAGYDDPANGVQRGQLALNHTFIAAEVERIGKLVQRFGTTSPQAKKIEAAKAQNAKAEQKVKTPPTVGSKGTRAPQGNKMPTFKTEKEATEWFMNGGYNDLDLGE
jgi:hypothetical protein